MMSTQVRGLQLGCTGKPMRGFVRADPSDASGYQPSSPVAYKHLHATRLPRVRLALLLAAQKEEGGSRLVIIVCDGMSLSAKLHLLRKTAGCPQLERLLRTS